MAPSVVTQFASSADATTHTIPLSGKTIGKGLILICGANATITPPAAPWVVEHNVVYSSSYSLLCIRLPGASNTSAVTTVPIVLNGPRALAAVVIQDDINESVAMYFGAAGGAPTTGNPALMGTGLHTFPTRDQTFAFFGLNMSGTSPITPFDVVSYDNGYTELADTGDSAVTNMWRFWLAQNDAMSMSSNGVTATGNGLRPTNVGATGNGMFAYQNAAASAPANTVAPAITGSLVTGQVVTCSTGTWTGFPTPTFTYQWKRGGVNISGATSSTYTLQVADEAQNITCTVTATNTGGSASANSNTVVPSGVGTAPTNSVAPVMSGTASQGQSLGVTNGTWTGTPTSFSYQWRRNSAAITGATTNSYILQAVDVGQVIKCTVTAFNAFGNASADSNTATIAGPTQTKPATVHRKRGAVWETLLFGGSTGGSGSGSAGPSGGFFNAKKPEDYGAKRDCRAFHNASIANGSSALTVTDAAFVSTDVGKTIVIYGPGANLNQTVLQTTISAVVDATHVTLANPALQAATSKRGFYGSNDTDPINQAIAGAIADAQADKSNYAEVLFSSGEYLIASPTVKGSAAGGTAKGNCQIQLPAIDPHLEKVTLVLRGSRDSSAMPHWQQNVPLTSGVILRTSLAGQSPDATWDAPSVIGSMAQSFDWGYGTTSFSNMLCVIDGITIIAPPNPSIVGINLKKCAEANIGTLAILADATPTELNSTLHPTNDQGIGLYMPTLQNNDNTNLRVYSCYGFYWGLLFGDHFVAERVAMIYCNTAMAIPKSSGVIDHGSAILYASVEATDTMLNMFGGAGGTYPLFIGMLNTETGGAGIKFKDGNNNLVGVCYYTDNTGAHPTVTGCQRFKIIDLNSSPGANIGPTLPASNTPLTNPFFRDAAVTISGGSVSSIQVDGQGMGIINGTVIVPNNKTINIVYTTAPTWRWTLL